MINSISQSAPLPLPPKGADTLTDEQQSLIADTLANYDGDNLSKTDAQEIAATFSDAGIAPGVALGEAMASLGFDAKEVGFLANVEAPPAPKPEKPTPTEKLTPNLNLSEVVNYIENTVAQGSDETATGSLYDNVKSHFQLQDGESLINVMV